MSGTFDIARMRADAAALLASTNPAPAAVPERKQSQVWINVGMYIPSVDDDGNETQLFVSLPVSIPFDQMKTVEVKQNSSAKWKELAAAKNTLVEALQTLAAKTTPGQAIALPKLSVEMYHKQGIAAPNSGPAEEGSLSDKLAKMLAA